MTKEYKIHPYCAAFPDMEGEEFESLRRSLKDNGQQDDCLVWGDWLIDGKNRERALKANKQQIRYAKWTPTLGQPDDIDNELRSFVLAKNMDRRHMDASQRAMVAAKLVSQKHHKKADENNDCANLHKVGMTQESAAESLNVSRRSVATATIVVEKAAPEIVHAVETGEVTVSDAAKVAGLPKPAQKAALKKVENGEAKTLTQAAGVKPEPKLSTVLRNGKMTAAFDCEPILKSFGAVARSIDEAARLSNLNNSPEHKRCIAKLSNAREEFDAFAKLISKVGAKKAK